MLDSPLRIPVGGTQPTVPDWTCIITTAPPPDEKTGDFYPIFFPRDRNPMQQT